MHHANFSQPHQGPIDLIHEPALKWSCPCPGSLSTISGFSGSTTESTESTAKGAKRVEYCDTTLLLSAVLADFTSESRSVSSTGRAMAVRTSTAFVDALCRESETTVG
uniref:Uncharacterized protein n=1 Tax=Solanum lycopersicum TaxID=4081 RepID=A0A3Q7FSR1_SOLLC